MDVILYMIIKKEENQNQNQNGNIGNNNNNINVDDGININIDNNNGNNNERINANIRAVIYNQNQQSINRGFNIFLRHGLSEGELRLMRILFHLSVHQRSMQRGEDLDWSPDGMYRREERWLINQLNTANNNNNGIGNERTNEYNNIGNNNYTILNVNDSENENDEYLAGRRYIESLISYELEPSYIFLMGFCIGFLINIFGLLLLLCKFKNKFKIGLICGILLSIVFYSLTIFSAR